jgi:hypothetical protein
LPPYLALNALITGTYLAVFKDFLPSPSYFKLHVRWLSSLTPVTYLSKLLGIRGVAAFL